MKQLINGLIKAGTTCPFSENCHSDSNIARGCPVALGEVSRIDYSCGMARYYDSFGTGTVERGRD